MSGQYIKGIFYTEEQFEVYSEEKNTNNTKEFICKKIEQIQTELLTRLNSAFGLKVDVKNPAIETNGAFYKSLPIEYNGVSIDEPKMEDYIEKIKECNNNYYQNPTTTILKDKDNNDVTRYDLPTLKESPEVGDYYCLLFLDIRYDTVKIKTIMGW